MDAPVRRQHADYPDTHRIREEKTFREAAESFVQNRGDGRHLPRIIAHMGDQMLRDIVPFDLEVMALALFQSRRIRHAIARASPRPWP